VPCACNGDDDPSCWVSLDAGDPSDAILKANADVNVHRFAYLAGEMRDGSDRAVARRARAISRLEPLVYRMSVNRASCGKYARRFRNTFTPAEACSSPFRGD